MEYADGSLKHIDLNNDGYISYREYVTIMKQDHPH